MKTYNNKCRFCGVTLTDKNASDEHIFPIWLLQKYGLFDNKLLLINKSTIAYRQMRIPCCSPCNNGPLARLENDVKTILENHPRSLEILDVDKLILWMAKIFLGILFKETELFFDRSETGLGPIVNNEFIASYNSVHSIIYKAITTMPTYQDNRSSFFLFKIQEKGNSLPFYFMDNILGKVFCMKIDDIGIISCFDDDLKVNKSLSDVYKKMVLDDLSCVQFDEFSAIVCYKAYSYCDFDNMKKSDSTLSPRFEELNISDTVRLQIHKEKSIDLYPLFLAEFWKKWGITKDDILFPPNQLKTSLGKYGSINSFLDL